MSMFTRRHYVWLASVMRDARHQTLENGTFPFYSDTIEILADALSDESEAFDRQRFIDAIYGDPTDHSTSNSGDVTCPLPKTTKSSS